MPQVRHDGLRIHYRCFGPDHGTPIVLVHGLMLSTYLFDRLAGRLPDRRVIAVDVRGHGGSSRPEGPWRYSWDLMADDIVAVLDDLGVDRAVVGGLSLGANVALAFGLRHPDRAAGLVVEMPVLARSETAARAAFGIFAVVLRLASPVLRPLGAALRRLPWPDRPPELRAAAEALSVQPVASAAVMEGLSASPIPGVDPEGGDLAAIDVPTLVVGHHFDQVHALDDARFVAEAIRGARLLEVTTIADLRVRPGRLADAIDEVFAEVLAPA